MRMKTLTSLLILCGSTAAVAQITALPPGQDVANNVVETNAIDEVMENSALTNDTMTDDDGAMDPAESTQPDPVAPTDPADPAGDTDPPTG